MTKTNTQSDQPRVMWNQRIHVHGLRPLHQWQDLHILPGLNAVTGEEGLGKTRLLRELHKHAANALWLGNPPENSPW